MVRLLGISGSLRRGAFNRRLLRAAARELPDGASLELWDGLGNVPPFNEDEEVTPSSAVTALREAIGAADGILIATPEYNRSLPGQLKNALDWASRPQGRHAFVKKPVVVLSASPSPRGAAQAQAETRKVLEAMGAQVIDGLRVARAHRAFDDEDRLADANLRRQLANMAGELVAASQKQQVSMPSPIEER